MIGNRTRVKVAKNKVAPPFKLAEFDIMYGQGISREGSLLDVGVDLDIVKKSGAWFTYEGEQLGQGRENAKQFLHDNVDMMLEIMEKIRVAAGINDIDLTEDGEELGDVAEAAAAVIAEAEAVEKSNGAKASSKK
jgi:recombination protein RecA